MENSNEKECTCQKKSYPIISLLVSISVLALAIYGGYKLMAKK